MLNRSAADWGNEIRRLRHAKFIKQSALADALNVDQATVSRWERNISVPDLAMQRRLTTYIRQPAVDEFVLKHAVAVALGQTMLSDKHRIMHAVSVGYSNAHDMSPEQMSGRSTRGMHTDESEELWQHARRNGFYRGDIASITVITRVHSLSGHRRSIPVKTVWTPVHRADGEILLRLERVDLQEHELAARLASNGGPIRIVSMDDLVR